MRVVATANIDDDPWTELVLVVANGTKRDAWWLTAQFVEDPIMGEPVHFEDVAGDCS
jgi:hypothetical protein